MSAQHTPGRVLAPFERIKGCLQPFRHISREEWLHAWHYARYDRRNGQISAFVGPTLREAAREVMRQKRDVLVARQSMAKTCHPLSAVLATNTEFRAAIAKATGSAAS